MVSVQNILPSTTDEEMIILTNRREFDDIHARLHAYLRENKDAIEHEVKENIERIKEFDVDQFRSGGKRSIKEMRDRGIEIRILPEHFEALRALQTEMKSSRIPLLEVLKRERIAEVNLIPNTKVATIIHDAIDHVWLYALLADKGVLKKYGKLFASIGNPDKIDIFKREGEIVASIGYGVRYWAYVEAGFKPHVSIGQIAERIEAYFDEDELKERHMDAYRHIRDLAKAPTMREAQSLAFVFSNYLVELNEQRRKHGPIKFRNDDLEVVGELDPGVQTSLAFSLKLMPYFTTVRTSIETISCALTSFLNSIFVLQRQQPKAMCYELMPMTWTKWTSLMYNCQQNEFCGCLETMALLQLKKTLLTRTD